MTSQKKWSMGWSMLQWVMSDLRDPNIAGHYPRIKTWHWSRISSKIKTMFIFCLFILLFWILDLLKPVIFLLFLLLLFLLIPFLYLFQDCVNHSHHKANLICSHSDRRFVLLIRAFRINNIYRVLSSLNSLFMWNEVNI